MLAYVRGMLSGLNEVGLARQSHKHVVMVGIIHYTLQQRTATIPTVVAAFIRSATISSFLSSKLLRSTTGGWSMTGAILTV